MKKSKVRRRRRGLYVILIQPFKRELEKVLFKYTLVAALKVKGCPLVGRLQVT